MCDTQGLSLVHAECPGSLAITVTFWPVLLAVARLAVDFIHTNGDRCAVQVLPAHHCKNNGVHTNTLTFSAFIS